MKDDTVGSLGSFDIDQRREDLEVQFGQGQVIGRIIVALKKGLFGGGVLAGGSELAVHVVVFLGLPVGQVLCDGSAHIRGGCIALDGRGFPGGRQDFGGIGKQRVNGVRWDRLTGGDQQGQTDQGGGGS